MDCVYARNLKKTLEGARDCARARCCGAHYRKRSCIRDLEVYWYLRYLEEIGVDALIVNDLLPLIWRAVIRQAVSYASAQVHHNAHATHVSKLRLSGGACP